MISSSHRKAVRPLALRFVLAPCIIGAAFGSASAQQTTTSTGTPSLPEVTVSDQENSAAGPTTGFRAQRATAGTKTDTPLHETPQSVSVVTRQQLDATAADSLDQAFEYTAGIMSQTGGVQRRTSTGFTVRGFNVTGSAPLYLNGSRFPINSLSGTLEPYAYERIELLKGPASILYGQAAPGGLINVVSKRPTTEPLREVEVQAGSWDRKQIATDLGGALTEDGRFTYRLTALARDSDAMIQQIPDDRAQLNAALGWKIGRDTDLTVLAGYSKGKSIYDYGKPFDGSLLPNANGALSRKLFVGEEGFDHFDTVGKTLGYLFEHRFSDAWTFRQNLLRFDYTSDNAYLSVPQRITSANRRTVARTAASRDDADRGTTLDNQLTGRFATGAVDHTLLLGVDLSQRDFTRIQQLGTAPALDLYAPVYGGAITLAPATRTEQDQRQTGLYLQDQLKWGRWVGLIGGRYDEARNESTAVAASGASTATDEKSHAFSPRLGLMYLFDNGVAPYYSFTKSFQPASGTDFFGQTFKPTRGTQHEVGVKIAPPGMNAEVTVAAYELTQTNVTNTDPDHPGFSIQTGEVRSRGIEIEGRGRVTRQLELVAALDTIDARTTQSTVAANVGTRPTSVPRNQASLWADWKFDAVPGLSAGVGVRRIGVQAATATLNVPSYTVVDAALRYQVKHWRFALNIKNLANRNYVASCSFACFYGDERNALLSARYSW
jgi:iron complex outermembrane receptor protein